MKFKMIHENYNVLDLDRSLKFYEEALGLTERRRKVADDGSFIIVYIGNAETDFEMAPRPHRALRPRRRGVPSRVPHERLRCRPRQARGYGLHLL